MATSGVLTAEELDLSSKFQELTPSYTAYEYDEIVLELINRLYAKNTAWKDVYASSTGQMLIEFYAYVASLVLYYLERRAQECYLATARNRSSVVNLVKLINYTPKRKTSSTGTLRFSVPTARGKIIHIPVLTQVEDQNGTKFVVGYKVPTSSSDIYNYKCPSCDTVIPRPYAPVGQYTYTGSIQGGGYIGPTGLYVDLEAIQGELVTKEITSNGAENQVYFINHTDVENDTLSVMVDGVTWTRVSSFVESNYNDTHYRVTEEMDGRLKLYFGDNTKGKAPDRNSVITVRYLRTKGIEGNVYQTDFITTIKDVIYDEDNQVVDNISVTNVTKFLGGDEAEDIEEIREEAPNVFATGDRAVTRYDFIALIQNYAGVASVNVWGEYEELNGQISNYEMLNRVKICMILQNWSLPDDAFENEIASYIYDKSMMTVKYEFVDPVILYILPEIEVKVNENYTTAQAQSDVEEVLDDLLGDDSLGSTNLIGQDVRFSNIVKTLDQLSSIDYHHLWLHLYEELVEGYSESASSIGAADYGAILTYGSAYPNTVQIYVGDTKVAQDNGEGTISSVAGSSYAVTGTVDYDTGLVLVDISPSTTDTVSCRYRVTASGDIGVEERHIPRIVKDADGNNKIDFSILNS